MKIFIKSFFILLVLFIIACLSITYLALQGQPSTVQINQISAASAKHSQQLAQRIASTLNKIILLLLLLSIKKKLMV